MTKKVFVYEGIKRQLQAQIESGELAEGARVPSEHELAKGLGVSRNQTRQALRELEIEGYVVRRRGSGSYVAPAKGRVVSPIVGSDATIAIVFPRYLSVYARDVVDGFMQRIAMAGHQTIAYNIKFDEDSEAQSLRTISASGISALAVWVEHDTRPTKALLRELCERRLPVVQMDRRVGDEEVDFVVSNNEEIGYRLTKALIDRGHQRVAFAGIEQDHASSVENRFKGYERALEEAGIPLDERLVADLKLLYDEPSAVTGRLMGLYDRPTAVACVHDLAASLLFGELVELGYDVPDHVELAALEDGHPREAERIPMIAVSQRGGEIGMASADLLLARISDPDRPVQRCLIDPTDVSVDYEKVPAVQAVP